ncbi:MAG: hypothetical protein OXC06_08375 [Acidimicrobiaceae bacterium]|nr:hypothetical protein [Acidimicrobiaceae bacterium]
MNTFPYDSWEAALEAADGTTGYFTWGPGGNTASVVLAIIGIAISVLMAVMITAREDKLLNAAADRLADKYNSEG